MEDQPVCLSSSIDACLKDSPTTHPGVETDHEPFLNYDSNTEFSFHEKSRLYNSLVALVKAKYPFDDALQDRAVQFLDNLEPEYDEEDRGDRLVIDLVPSSDGSPSRFVESILTLHLSPRSTMVAAALSLLKAVLFSSKPPIRLHLVKSGIVTNVLTPVHSHTPTISGKEPIFHHLTRIINQNINLASPHYLDQLGITAAVDKFNLRDMIFQKVILPSSQFVTFLISTRFILSGDLFKSFMELLDTLIYIGPFHRPTLEFVLASPIVMAFSSCLSFIEDNSRL